MNYNYPSKDLLEERSSELDNNKYYGLKNMIYSRDFNDKLLLPIGIDDQNEKYFINMHEESGLLITGETGSGKSILLNDIVISLLFKNNPKELQLFFIDPRNVEFNIYKDIPHVKGNVYSSLIESLVVLKMILDTLEERRKLFIKNNAKNIDNYNIDSKNPLPQVVLIIDECSDIFRYKEANIYIKRILSEGYKFGVHLIMATSSYLKEYSDTEIIDMFNYIISFDLASEEQAKYLRIKKANLLSICGEALVKCEGDNIVNIQVPYVSDLDIEEVVDYIIKENKKN